MKKAFYLSLSLASVLCAPSLFASASSHLDDQENIAPKRHKVHLNNGEHFHVVLNHRRSKAVDAARVMHEHAEKKTHRLNAKAAAAVKGGAADFSALQTRLVEHDTEKARLHAQHQAAVENHKTRKASQLKALRVHEAADITPHAHSEARAARIAAPDQGQVDLTAKQKILDQGELGACTAHGTTACLNQAGITTDPSRMAIYYHARVDMGIADGKPQEYVKQDSGAAIANAASAATRYGGIIPESVWTYSDKTRKLPFGSLPHFEQQPGPECYHAGTDLENQVQFSFTKVDASTNGIIERLHAGTYVVFGMTLYNSFMTKVGADGVVPVPAAGEGEAGGHCMAVGGYFPNMKGDGVDYFKVQNSWGTSWGQNGFCYMPVSMFNNADTLGDMWYVSGAKASRAAAAAAAS